MTEQEKIQDRELLNQIIDNMNLFDDELMSMVFDRNIPAAELLLKIVLRRDNLKVISVVGQKEFQSPLVGGRSIRLDILAEDDKGKQYDIEVQKQPKGAHIRRARFNSSMLDSRMLKEGQQFSELRDSYIIFITETDIFGHGIPIYTINRYFEETSEPFNDGSHIVYVNGSYRGNDDIGKLMHDFACRESRNFYYPDLADGIEHFKEQKGGRAKMSEAVERYAERIAERYADSIAEKKAEKIVEKNAKKYEERGAMNKQIEMIKNLMETMNMTAEQVMSAMRLSDKDKAAVMERL